MDVIVDLNGNMTALDAETETQQPETVFPDLFTEYNTAEDSGYGSDGDAIYHCRDSRAH